MLAWSISQQNQITYTSQSLDLYKLAQSTRQLFIGLSQTKEIQIINNIEKDTLITADKNMVMTIMRNLLSNAIKFTPNGKTITITTKNLADSTWISIADQGQGIDSSHLARLFRKSEYFSTKGTNGEKGSGLGLLLCKDFIKKHNGKIWAESELGKGSTFHFSLPK